MKPPTAAPARHRQVRILPRLEEVAGLGCRHDRVSSWRDVYIEREKRGRVRVVEVCGDKGAKP